MPYLDPQDPSRIRQPGERWHPSMGGSPPSARERWERGEQLGGLELLEAVGAFARNEEFRIYLPEEFPRPRTTRTIPPPFGWPGAVPWPPPRPPQWPAGAVWPPYSETSNPYLDDEYTWEVLMALDTHGLSALGQAGLQEVQRSRDARRR